MEWIGTLAIAALLALGAGGLMAWHVRTWRACRRRASDAAELAFRQRQFRRRMRTSALMAVIAVALPAGQAIIVPYPRWGVAFWGVILLLLGWMCLLAAVDLLATRAYYGRMHDSCRLEEARLKGELNRAHASRRNGRSNGKPRIGPEPSGHGPAT